MGKGTKGASPLRKEQKQLACILCTVVLVIIIIVLGTLYFSIFKPKDPKVQVPTLQLLSFNEVGYPSAVTSLDLNLNLQVSMYNPNRATFRVEDGSTACLYYYGSQVGFAPVPQFSIPSQSFSSVAVGLTMQNPLQGPPLHADVLAGILPLNTAVIIRGHVTTLNVFSHHSDVISKCSLNISFNTRGIQSYTCHGSYSLDD